MSAIICLLSCMLCGVISYAKLGKIFAPPVLLNAMWGFVHIANLVLGWNVNEIGYLILSLPPMAFSIGFLMLSYEIHPCKRLNYTSGEKIKINLLYTPRMTYIILACFLVFSVNYFYFIYQKFILYFDGNWWMTLRKIVWYENTKQILEFKYPLIPMFTLTAIYNIMYKSNKKQYVKYSLILLFISSFIWSILTTSRTSTFTLLALIILSYYIYYCTPAYAQLQKKLTFSKKMLILSAIICSLYSFIFVSIQKDTAIGHPSNFVVYGIKSISTYTNLSSACFVEWYNHGIDFRNGANTFRFIFAVLSRLGFDVDVANTSSGGIFIQYGELSSNAFTVARNYIEDFGVAYMFLMLLVFGAIHGVVYKKAINSSGRYHLRYSVLCGVLYIPLLYQILTDAYLNILSQWIQYAIWVYIFTSKFMLKIKDVKKY